MTSRPVRPAELNWVTPFLNVIDVAASLQFYQDVFGFREHQVVKNNKEQMVFARIVYQQCNVVLMSYAAFAQEEHRGVAPAAGGFISPVSLYVYCDDLAERYQKAQHHQLKILLPLAQRFWGDTTFRVVDINGYIWDFATYTDDFNPALLPPELI